MPSGAEEPARTRVSASAGGAPRCLWVRKPRAAACPGRGEEGSRSRQVPGGVAAPWGGWEPGVSGADSGTAWPASSSGLALLPRRALPVMYAVALDLRVFANNVSSVLGTVLLKLKLGFCLFLNFMSFFQNFCGLGCGSTRAQFR